MTTIKHKDNEGNFDGREIHLEETNDITKLKNQYMLLGMNELAYSPWAIEIQEKIKKLSSDSNEKTKEVKHGK